MYLENRNTYQLLRKAKTVLLSVFISILCFSIASAQEPINQQDSIAVANVWQDFRKAFAEKDLEQLGKLSVSQIYCSECYDNTSEEKERNEKLMQTDGWGDFVEQAYYVTVVKFLQEDIAVISDYIGNKIISQAFQIYNDEANATLFTQKLKKKQLSNPVQCYSIIITLTEPSPEFEGLQAVFTFVKTKKGFRFCGYGTVP